MEERRRDHLDLPLPQHIPPLTRPEPDPLPTDSGSYRNIWRVFRKTMKRKLLSSTDYRLVDSRYPLYLL